MKKSILVMALLACCSLAAHAESFIVQSKGGEKFRLYIGGTEYTTDLTDYLRVEIEPGWHQCRVKFEDGNTVDKRVGVAIGDKDPVYELKKNRKGQWTMKRKLGTGSNTAVAPGEMPVIPGSVTLDNPIAGEKKGAIKFESTFVEMGAVAMGGTLLYDLNIKSTGDAPLEITDVQVSEPFIEIVNYPRSPVASGQFAKIKLKVTAPAEEGHYTEKVIVFGNTFMGKNNVNVEFDVTGQAVADSGGDSEPIEVEEGEEEVETPTAPNYITITDPRDRQQYRTLKIGSQWWFAQNLNYGAEKSYLYPKARGKAAVYGRTYAYPAILNGNVCPMGWHVATEEDWRTLFDYLGSNAGNKLKSAELWDGTGTTGMDILGAGFGRTVPQDDGRQGVVDFGDWDNSVVYWAERKSTSYGTTFKLAHAVRFTVGVGEPDFKEEPKFSSSLNYCRCVKD